MSRSNSALAVALLNGASIVGRLTVGHLSDKGNAWAIAGIMLFITSALTVLLWGLASSNLAGVLAFGVGYGAMAGGWTSTWSGFAKLLIKDDNPAGSTSLIGYLMLSRGVGGIFSTPISSLLQHQPSPNSTVLDGHPRLGFEVNEGRFERMIVYVATCFAVASGIAVLGWGFDKKKERFRVGAGRL